MRIQLKLLPHAKQRLLERYGLTKLPEGPRILVRCISNNRRIYRIGEVYFVWRKSDKKIITFLPKEGGNSDQAVA